MIFDTEEQYDQTDLHVSTFFFITSNQSSTMERIPRQ